MARRSIVGRFARLLAGATILAAVLVVPLAAHAGPIPDPGCSPLTTCIKNEALYELTDGAHNTEHPAGSNCNYFSTQWHDPGATRCPNGEWAEKWCMDFVHWIYQAEGASVAGLGSTPHLAASAKVYGQNHNTWNPNTPHVGDMALLYTNEHVEIVVSVNTTKRTINTVSGNWSDQIFKKDGQPWSNYIGFASPVGA